MGVIIEKNAVLVVSWGYDQTNVTFFRVTKRTPKMVELEHLKNEIVETSQGGLAGKVIPAEGHGEFVRHKVSTWQGDEEIHTKYGLADIWNGQPQKFTSYA